jgi:hypothetical protein
MQPLATPCTNRSRSSVAISLPNPNGIAETANNSSPNSVVRLTPTWTASQPPRNEPGINPAG